MIAVALIVGGFFGVIFGLGWFAKVWLESWH